MSRITKRSGAPVVVVARVVCLAFTQAGCAATPAVTCEDVLHDQFVVISAWSHRGVVGDPPNTYGIDIDRRVSDGSGPNCFDEEDFVSPRTGLVGVDNQYAANLLPFLERAFLGGTALVPEGMSAAVLHQLALGEELVGLDVEIGADGIARVDVVRLEPVDAMEVDAARGALAPDQRFHVLHRERVSSRCTGSELEVVMETFHLPFTVTVGAVPIHDVRFRLTVDASGELRDGELGARYPVSLVVDVAHAFGELRFDESTARAVAGPDVDPSADPTVCESISIGLGLRLAPAVEVR